LKKPPFWRVFLTCLATHVPKRRGYLWAETPVGEPQIVLLSPAKFEEAAILAGFPHLPRDACSKASGAILQADTPVNEAPIVLPSPAIDCM
jgi:hypothetical protein